MILHVVVFITKYSFYVHDDEQLNTYIYEESFKLEWNKIKNCLSNTQLYLGEVKTCSPL